MKKISFLNLPYEWPYISSSTSETCKYLPSKCKYDKPSGRRFIFILSTKTKEEKIGHEGKKWMLPYTQ